MAESTGPILAAGGIVIANRVVFNNQPINWKQPIATGLAAMILAGSETVLGPKLPRALAIMALLAVTLSRVDPSVPSPAESALAWFNGRK